MLDKIISLAMDFAVLALLIAGPAMASAVSI